MSGTFICAQCRKVFTLDKNRCCPGCHSFNIKPFNKQLSQKELPVEYGKDSGKRQFSKPFLVCIILILTGYIGYNEVYRKIIKREGVSQSAAQITYYKDKKAFESAKKIGTLISYQTFLDNYPTSAWREYAIYFRDKAAYIEAINSGSQEAIVHFIQIYPDSSWIPNAKHHLRNTFDRDPKVKIKKSVATETSEHALAKDHLKKSKEDDVLKLVKDIEDSQHHSKPKTSHFKSTLFSFSEARSADNLFQEKEYDRAIVAYQKVVTSQASSKEAVAHSLLHQALSFQALGDKDTARVMLRKVTNRFPTSEYSDEARTLLREL